MITTLHEPCACGGLIGLDTRPPPTLHVHRIIAAVQLHQQTERHRQWADGAGFRQWADEASKKGRFAIT